MYSIQILLVCFHTLIYYTYEVFVCQHFFVHFLLQLQTITVIFIIKKKYVKEKEYIMQKTRYPITLLHKLIAGTLLLLAVCLFFNVEVYSDTADATLSCAYYSFLQPGDYSFEITYENATVGEQFLVTSEYLVSSDNTQGALIGSATIDEPSGVKQFLFHLDEGAREVQLSTTMGEDAAIMRRVHLQSVQLISKDNYFLSAILLLSALLILLLGRYVPKERYTMPLLLILMGLLASIPLMNGLLKEGHDLTFHLARIEGTYQALAAGIFPVRVNPYQMEGFGNLTGAMYPQFFLYIAALLRLAGVSTMLSYKVLLVGVNIGTALFSYYAVKNICNSKKIGFIASVLYTFSTYRLIDAYTGACLGELLALTFLPLIVWGIYELFWGDHRKWYLLALGVSGVLESHILSTEMYLFFLILTALYWLFTKKDCSLPRVLSGIKAVVFTILLNAYFVIPFLYYSTEGFQVFNMGNDLSLSAAYFSQMFSFFTHATGQNKVLGYTQGEMPLSIGGILILGALCFCVTLMRRYRTQHDKNDTIGLVCLAFGILGLVMSSWLFPWKTIQSIPALSYLVAPLEFVWRLLGPASMFLAITSAIGIVNFAEKLPKREWLYGVVFAIVLCSTTYYFDQVEQTMPEVGSKMAIVAIDDAFDNSYLYEDSSISDFSRKYATIFCSNDSEILYSNYYKKATYLSVNTIVTKYVDNAYLLFPLYGYTGYEVRVNGEPVEVTRIEGRVACELPAGDAFIEVEYVGLPFFQVADWITLLTVVVTVGYMVFKNKRALR